MDLLNQWLGKDSAQHIRRIRNIIIKCPETGLKMIWERLEECYGSAKAIEDALFKKVDDFPKITSRGYQKLEN